MADRDTTLQLTIALANRAERTSSIAHFATHAGAVALFALVQDPQLGVMVPAPGFQQTLPGGAAWRRFLKACIAPGIHRSALPLAREGASIHTVACAADGVALVFVGEQVDAQVVAAASAVLPALGSALRLEQDVVVATGALRAARDGARNAHALTMALDDARVDLEFKARSLEEARARAEDAGRAKDEFLAMLGHELRNPLAPIVTALHLMRLRGTQSREQEIIERHVSHLTRLVDDLLDVSRITQGKIELRCERIELAQVVSRAIEMVSPLLEQRRQRLVVEVPAVGMPVMADPQRLGQVLTNLLTNASRYSETESRITLRAALAGEKVRIEVCDNGVGIEPEMLSRIFETFIQDRRSPDDSERGLGLGLAIVNSLVTLHGGTVTASSRGKSRGSVFTVELPVAAAAAEAPIDSEPPVAQVPKPVIAHRVMIVDDNADGAEMLCLVLTTFGYEVKSAPDGPSALALARVFKPTIALLDIGLPVMDGFELAERLRAEQNGAPLRLIAITGYGQEGDRIKSKAAGFDAHLVKPVDMALLKKLLIDQATALVYSS
ncbi:MAG TPA: ATP-binding protein [Vicinamibacterales bacterium]|nr:ATP-binding protein [Vicinamibacterales bacterium]